MATESVAEFIARHDAEDAELKTQHELALVNIESLQTSLSNEEAAHQATRAALTSEQAAHEQTKTALADANLVILDLREQLENCQNPSQLPQVMPLSSKVVHEGFGVCQHANFQTNNVHIHQSEIMERYGQMHIAQMRSLYVPNLNNFQQVVDGCRAYGVKWNATVATPQTTEAQVRDRIKHMAENNADIIGWVEGMNEPNEGTGWVSEAVRNQWVIWDEVKKQRELHTEFNPVILSPSMHDVRLDNANGAHWKDFAEGSITIGTGASAKTYKGKDLCQMVAVHCYPAGSVPDTKRAERVQWVYDAFGFGMPIKFSEWGYTNTLGLPKSSRTGGHKVASAEASAVYDCQAVFDFANNSWQVMRYEMMDDPDANNLSTESNFGLWKVQSVTGNPDTTWTPKPVVDKLTAILSALKDPGGDYTTTPVGLKVTAPEDVRTCLVQKRTGETTLWLWRHGEVWDPTSETSITLGSVQATVEHDGGTSTVQVGPQPVAVNVG